MKVKHRDLPKNGKLLNRLIAARGVVSADPSIKDMLHYRDLLNAERAATILADALQAGQRITIAGDYDVDGATGVAIGVRAMRMMGYAVDFIVPDRNIHGYGLTPGLVDIIKVRGCDLILTVDNGISSFEGVAHANALGMRVVVTDHHLAAETVPDALCIVNPNQPDCKFPSKHLCGAGVMFYVMIALRAELIKREILPIIPNLGDLLDLVALATIADVVKMDTNNRVLGRAGLARIRAGHCVPAIKAIAAVAKRRLDRLTSADLGFAIGPRLNAAGRLEDMTTGIKALLEDDDAEAKRYAEELDGINRARREIEESMKADALTMMAGIQSAADSGDPAIVLFREDWHAGVIGILASRIKDAFNKPAIMFATGPDGELRGSARSIPALNMRDAIAEAAKSCRILKFGGHAMAAGLTIMQDELPAFRGAFNAAVLRLTEGLDLSAVIETDGEMPDVTIDDILAAEVEPWGVGYSQPVFDGEFKVIAQRLIGDGRHLKLKVQNGSRIYDAVMFFQEELLPEMISAVYSPTINEYRDSVTIQLSIQRVLPAIMIDTMNSGIMDRAPVDVSTPTNAV